MYVCFYHSTDTDIGYTENETEVSFFNREFYETFKANPQVRTISPVLSTYSYPDRTSRSSGRANQWLAWG